MQETAIEAPPKQGSPLAPRESQTMCCVIAIGRDPNGEPTGVRVFPTRTEDAHIYYPRARDAGASDYPRELAWVVNHLRRGERVVIRAKPDQPDVFDHQEFEVAFPDHFVATGPVKRSLAKTRKGYRWDYNVILERRGKVLQTLDPTVIVTEEP